MTLGGHRESRPGTPGVSLLPLARLPLSVAHAIRLIEQVIVGALRSAWRHRVLGLSAEAGFWQLLSLPSALLGLLGTVGYFRGTLGTANVSAIENRILRAAQTVLSDTTVQNTLKPTLNTVLTGGRADVISVGFLLSLWSGSSAMATFVNTITIAYDQRVHRSAIRSRLLALGLYLGSISAGTLLLTGLVIGPAEVAKIPVVAHHHWAHQTVHIAYYPILLALSLGAIATLYHLAVPIRPRWRNTVPGAVVALVLWTGGATGLRAYVSYVFRRTLDYGALASPVAVLLFFYVTALAVLLGAEVNAEIDRRRLVRVPVVGADGAAPAVATSNDDGSASGDGDDTGIDSPS